MLFFFFFKQKTAYEMRISDWSSDVCSSDLEPEADEKRQRLIGHFDMIIELVELARHLVHAAAEGCLDPLRVIRCQNRLEGGFEDQPLRPPPPPSMTGKVVGEPSGQQVGTLDVLSSIPSPGPSEARTDV